MICTILIFFIITIYWLYYIQASLHNRAVWPGSILLAAQFFSFLIFKFLVLWIDCFKFEAGQIHYRNIAGHRIIPLTLISCLTRKCLAYSIQLRQQAQSTSRTSFFIFHHMYWNLSKLQIDYITLKKGKSISWIKQVQFGINKKKVDKKKFTSSLRSVDFSIIRYIIHV
jgi:hypothetical protein